MNTSFLDLILSWPTVFYSVILGVLSLYWLFMAFGVLTADGIEPDLDLDLDTDLDVDLDTEIEIDADLDGDTGELADSFDRSRRWHPFKSLLVWLNLGKVPLLFLISISTVIAWGASALLTVNTGLGIMSAFLLAGAIGLLGAKLFTQPFIPLFRRMSRDVKDVDYIGTIGKMKLPADADRFGQMEVNHEDDFLLVNVKPAPGHLNLTAGSRVVIVGRTPDQRYYLAEPDR